MTSLSEEPVEVSQLDLETGVLGFAPDGFVFTFRSDAEALPNAIAEER